ncbi:hypothetical protein [Roseobacter litoralis]|uniref:Uncharacterized protein n=1 Tax=Roseobacter litoralis (strain ATCC 49566 / DSM 6996 / JCM 21268 / NBRC 15278 / OCh 149) TaxID=391595 RepID=F7ZBK4_ROSLO|nr:hypothetical protein [Roseobacter litoralis]AEI95586.1 hypothetical protein RLO149_c036640 [Roseobacter litoralis Och 149]
MTDIIITENLDIPIKREIGFVSTTDVSESAEAIAQLKKEAISLGGNALILLRVGKANWDTHIATSEFYARGVVVEV